LTICYESVCALSYGSVCACMTRSKNHRLVLIKRSKIEDNKSSLKQLLSLTFYINILIYSSHFFIFISFIYTDIIHLHMSHLSIVIFIYNHISILFFSSPSSIMYFYFILHIILFKIKTMYKNYLF